MNQNEQKKKHIDLDSTTSELKGIAGLFETLLRKFKNAMHIITMLPVYLAGSMIFGLSLVPGVSLFRYCTQLTEHSSAWIHNITIAFCLAVGYLLYGFTLIFLAPLVNWLLRIKLSEWRGPYYSSESFKWFLHNALTYMVRFTFLEFVTPSPLGLLFYRMMGMKIAKGTIINSTWISDPCMIEMGEKTTIGGSVTIVAHYGQGGLLVIAPVKIGKSCTVGLKASIMGGVSIGDGAKILPHSVLLPKTQVPAGETWGGVPARKIELEKSNTHLKSA